MDPIPDKLTASENAKEVFRYGKTPSIKDGHLALTDKHELLIHAVHGLRLDNLLPWGPDMSHAPPRSTEPFWNSGVAERIKLIGNLDHRPNYLTAQKMFWRIMDLFWRLPCAQRFMSQCEVAPTSPELMSIAAADGCNAAELVLCELHIAMCQRSLQAAAAEPYGSDENYRFPRRKLARTVASPAMVSLPEHVMHEIEAASSPGAGEKRRLAGLPDPRPRKSARSSQLGDVEDLVSDFSAELRAFKSELLEELKLFKAEMKAEADADRAAFLEQLRQEHEGAEAARGIGAGSAAAGRGSRR